MSILNVQQFVRNAQADWWTRRYPRSIQPANVQQARLTEIEEQEAADIRAGSRRGGAPAEEQSTGRHAKTSSEGRHAKTSSGSKPKYVAPVSKNRTASPETLKKGAGKHRAP